MENYLENPEHCFEIIIEELERDDPSLMAFLFKEFDSYLLSQKSQRGILLLIFILKKAIEETFTPIPEETPEKLLEDIEKFLRK